MQFMLFMLGSLLFLLLMLAELSWEKNVAFTVPTSQLLQ